MEGVKARPHSSLSANRLAGVTIPWLLSLSASLGWAGENSYTFCDQEPQPPGSSVSAREKLLAEKKAAVLELTSKTKIDDLSEEDRHAVASRCNALQKTMTDNMMVGGNIETFKKALEEFRADLQTKPACDPFLKAYYAIQDYERWYQGWYLPFATSGFESRKDRPWTIAHLQNQVSDFLLIPKKMRGDLSKIIEQTDRKGLLQGKSLHGDPIWQLDYLEGGLAVRFFNKNKSAFEIGRLLVSPKFIGYQFKL
jgi:hypothetical protein